MASFTRRLRGAIGMGVTWAITWVAAGLAIGVSSVLVPALPWSAFFDIFDAPLPALALPGFIGGAIFSVVLGFFGQRRRFDQLSLPVFAAWGALGGVLLSLVPQTMAALGLATLSDRFASAWSLTAIIMGPITLLSAASACATLLIARRATRAHAETSRQGGALLPNSRRNPQPLPTGHGLDALRHALRETHGAPADRFERAPDHTSG